MQVRLFRRTLSVLSILTGKGLIAASQFSGVSRQRCRASRRWQHRGCRGSDHIRWPGALFWMWLIALLGMSTSLFECALAQLYKRRHGDETFRGVRLT